METNPPGDLGMLHRPVMAPLSGQQPLDADFASPCFIRPLGAISSDESLAVVLMHGGVDALLRIGRGSNQIDAEAIHVVGSSVVW